MGQFLLQKEAGITKCGYYDKVEKANERNAGGQHILATDDSLIYP